VIELIEANYSALLIFGNKVLGLDSSSEVKFGSTTHINLERAGLGVAYTKSMWWKVE
jgi:hypothetical protein